MLRRVKRIFELEASTGIFLIIGTIIALMIANSEHYLVLDSFFKIPFPIKVDAIGFYKNLTIHNWINDGLMTLFFFLIGLELKEEMMVGELSTKQRAALPAIAACGGVIAPALIFCFFNLNHPQNLSGFAIPTATDIAFAYGVLCLFGNKVSRSLKVFLISLAIFDDLAAILIIAFFYSKQIGILYIVFTFLVVMGLAFLNYRNSHSVSLYVILGIALWLVVLKSGVHPTVAGVILAVFIPNSRGLIKTIIHKIAPSVNFLVLPTFAFANSGVRVENFSSEIFYDPLVWGIVLGLFFGKQIGVMLFSFLAVKSNMAHFPRSSKGVNWLEFYGVSILTGIGFTMSFFIGSLSFPHDPLAFDKVKIAVLLGSFLSAIIGMSVIYFGTRSR